MGIHSGNGMGAAKAIPGHRTFKGSPARANAQAEISRLIADLPPGPKEAMRREIAAAWKSGKTPQAVYDMVHGTLVAYQSNLEAKRSA
jgi:hypothetical protein